MKFILSFISVFSVFWFVPETFINDIKYELSPGTEIKEQYRNGENPKTFPSVPENKWTNDEDDRPNPPLEPIRTYTNSFGQDVQAPTLYATSPAGASARCKDGTYSFSRNRRGTCSGHGGVAEWLE